MDASKIAKKKFGQNFLKDFSVVQKIIKSIPKNNHKLVEIGAGLGDLTNELLKVKDLKAYEVDDDLSVFLKTRFKDEIENKKFILISNDVMQIWKQGSLENGDYDLVANLPYYIATTIILKALNDESCKNIIVMIQKEVAEKFSAQPKQKEFCALSVLANTITDVRVLFDVPATAFEPMPKVVSSVIEFKKFKNYLDIFSPEDIKRFEKFLKVAFVQPRKTLLKNLSQSYPKEEIKNIFLELNLPQNIRGHEIDTKTYHRLFEKISKVIKNGANQKNQ